MHMVTFGRLFTSLLALILAAGQTIADELSFEDRVRAFILENPEIIVEALSILSQREAQAALEARLSDYPELFDERTGLGLGDTSAPIRVIEFFDYRCAPCKAVHPKLVSLIARNPDLRVEMRQLPILSPGSERAARFALATREAFGDLAYGAVHDRLWTVKSPLNDVVFRRIAASLDLDFGVIAPLMQSDPVSQRIDFNRDVAIALEIIGTPAFVTRDSVVVGSTDIEALAQIWLSQ